MNGFRASGTDKKAGGRAQDVHILIESESDQDEQGQKWVHQRDSSTWARVEAAMVWTCAEEAWWTYWTKDAEYGDEEVWQKRMLVIGWDGDRWSTVVSLKANKKKKKKKKWRVRGFLPLFFLTLCFDLWPSNPHFESWQSFRLQLYEPQHVSYKVWSLY